MVVREAVAVRLTDYELTHNYYSQSAKLETFCSCSPCTSVPAQSRLYRRTDCIRMTQTIALLAYLGT